MSSGTIRRAQLVTPFGVGAMSVLVNGTSVITAGLDHWYDTDDNSVLAVEEYQEHDWRLESRLQVSEFRLPPDYRPRRQSRNEHNIELTVPVLRFPLWCFCMYCKRLELSTSTMVAAMSCPDNQHSSWKRRPGMSQVPFVTICPAGHLDDFPFDKWVHRTVHPSCKGPLRLKSLGAGEGLEGQRVVCDACHKQRSLQGITDAHFRGGEERTDLSEHLSSDDESYLCTGASPWLAKSEGNCGYPLRGALRAAGNVYFPKVESSIYLPHEEGVISTKVQDLVYSPPARATMLTLNTTDGLNLKAEDLRQHLRKSTPPEIFASLSDEELIAGYRYLTGDDEGETRSDSDTDLLTADEEWRYPEFQQIRETPKDDFLTTTDLGIHRDLAPYLERVRSVDVLRETRALRGFTRVRDGALKLSVGKAQMRRDPLPPTQDWLPGYVVKGEGIYVELDSSRLSKWENRKEIQARAQKITDHYRNATSRRGYLERPITPRFVLLHTLGHLVLNQLVYTCGYSSASLRERLFVSADPTRKMAGLLVYTAAGDSEGTMGGLVRMARPTNLHAIFSSALANARWCSTDPVCMDSGEGGQGTDSCNLAACHGCTLLPETSCEEFNKFLDRGLVIGTFDNPTLGYFSDSV